MQKIPWHYSNVQKTRDCEKKSINKILLWYARVASLKIRLLTLVLYITVVEWHVKSRRFSTLLRKAQMAMTSRHMIWLNPQSHLWFVDKSTLSVIIFAKIIYFVIILLSQTVVRIISRQPLFYTVRYSFLPFYIFLCNRKTRRTEVLRVSYVWTQRYLAITNLYSDCITRWL